VIQGNLNGIDFEFPSPAATHKDIERANRTRIPITTNIVQYYYQNQYNNSLQKIKHAGELIKKFERLIKNNPNSFVDINFDYINNYKMTKQEREFIIKLQGETSSLFITDYEIDMNQDLTSLKNNLDEIKMNYPKKIICPSIDLNTIPQIFKQKIEYLVDECQRININFGGFINRQENWLTLSKTIFNKPIWCNVVNLQRKFDTFGEPFASNSSIAFAYGIHTISVGSPRIRLDEDPEKRAKQQEKLENPIARILNKNTLYYEETKKHTKPQADVKSFINQQEEANVMRKSIGKEFFKEYAKKDALKNHLSNIKGRI